MQERQLSPAIVAAVLAAGDLALIAFELPTGWFADRFGHRASLVCGSAVQIAGMLCAWLGGGVPALVLSSVLIALGDGFRSGADQALLYRTCVALGRADAFQAIEARTRALETAALVALVLAGGAIVHVWGFAAGWAAETLLCAAGLALALLMIEPPPAPGQDDDDGAGAARPLVSHRLLALVLPASVLGAAAGAASFLVQTASGGGAARMTVLVAGIALAEAAGSAFAGRLGAGTGRAAWPMAAAGVVMMGAALTWPGLLVPVALALACLDGIAHPLRAAAIQRAAQDGWRARAASAASACDMVLSTITLPLAGLWRPRR